MLKIFKMTQTDTTAIIPSTILEIKSSCDKLINETQNEIRIFKIEQETFRDHLIEITEENHRLKKQLDVIQNSNSLFEFTKDDITAKECSADIIEMLQQEIHLFKAENDELKTIQEYLRKTIENHEKEIQSYREFVFGADSKLDERQKNLDFMQKLENTLVEREARLNEKSLYIETLESQKQMLLNEIELIQAELKGRVAKMDSNHETTINKTRDLITQATKEKEVLQKSLQQASIAIAEHMEKERIALQKMGEALGIAEAALREKEEVLKNKAILEKERDFLAATIGQVMEEASQKVEKQMQKMNRKIVDYQKKIEALRIESDEKIQCQMKAYTAVETLLKNTQNANKQLLHENEKLKNDREAMQQALDKIGIKMQPNGTLIYEDNDDKYLIDKLKSEIKQINSKCKIAVDDITHEFQKTVTRLSSENAELKAQLRILRG